MVIREDAEENLEKKMLCKKNTVKKHAEKGKNANESLDL